MSNNNDIKTYTAIDIKRYINKEMSLSEMHAIEKAALDDPFLADAIEGYSQNEKESSVDWQNHLNELQQRLENRTESRNIIPIYIKNWWQVAAIFILLVTGAGFLYNYLATSSSNENRFAKTETNTKPIDLADTSQRQKEEEQNSNHQQDNAKGDIQQNHFKIKDSLQKTAITSTQTEPKKNIQNDLRDETVQPPVVEPLESSTLSRKDNARITTEAPQPVSRENISMEKLRNQEMAMAAPNMSLNGVSNNFSGRVTSTDNKPIPGASVIVQNKGVGTLTDMNGNFTVILPDSTANIQVQSIGYEPANATIRNNLVDNNIILKQSNSGMDEVVVSAYSVRKRSTPHDPGKQLSGKAAGVSITTKKNNTSRARKEVSKSTGKTTVNAEPVMGWKAYQEYLAVNKHQLADTVHGEVTVSFQLNRNGEMSKFTIEKPLTTTTNEEAIRLIREGPAWKLLKGKTAKARVSVMF